MIHLCDNSKEVYELIDLMKENDVPIHQSILNTLIYQLLSEKNQEEAQHVVEVLFDTHFFFNTTTHFYYRFPYRYNRSINNCHVQRWIFWKWYC